MVMGGWSKPVWFTRYRVSYVQSCLRFTGFELWQVNQDRSGLDFCCSAARPDSSRFLSRFNVIIRVLAGQQEHQIDDGSCQIDGMRALHKVNCFLNILKHFVINFQRAARTRFVPLFGRLAGWMWRCGQWTELSDELKRVEFIKLLSTYCLFRFFPTNEVLKFQWRKKVVIERVAFFGGAFINTRRYS